MRHRNAFRDAEGAPLPAPTTPRALFHCCSGPARPGPDGTAATAASPGISGTAPGHGWGWMNLWRRSQPPRPAESPTRALRVSTARAPRASSRAPWWRPPAPPPPPAPRSPHARHARALPRPAPRTRRYLRSGNARARLPPPRLPRAATRDPS